MPTTTQNTYLSQRPLILGLSKVLFLALTQLSGVSALPFHAASYLHVLAEDEGKEADDVSLWLYLGVAAVLVLLGGAFAGLTIALMGQDEIYLQVIQDSGEGAEKRSAGKVLRLLKRGKHWVLVTLLLSNVITNETLPIVLDRSLGGGWPAVLGSTVLIVIFGEIVPQSICVRYGLPIGAWMSPFVLGLMYIMSPVAWPTAKLLDWLLGEDHGTVYKKAGLKTLVSLHRSLGEAGQRLHADEVTIISAVLDLKEKSIGTIMTPMDDVFTLSLDDVLDEEAMADILDQGYSRIPVHHPDNDQNFVGMLLVKMLITYDPEDAKPVREFALATLPETRPNTSCLDIVNFFQEGKSHMVLVSDHPGEDHGCLGVVTLEDVIEELIGEEIVDESDVFIDVHKAIRRLQPAPRTRVPRANVEKLQKTTTGDLVDIGEHEQLQAADLRRTITQEESTLASNGKPVARRMSGNSALNTRKKPPVISEETREHLKHLGPSNLASRPKATRFKSVMIKPGGDGQSPGPHPAVNRTRLERRISETQSDYTNGIGAGVVNSAGREASDGVQAVRTDYGTISTSPENRRPASANKAIHSGINLLDYDEYADGENVAPDDLEAKPTRPLPRTVDSEDDDQVGELPKKQRSRSPVYTKGPARSGSITENVVDTNGIRKVVLETTSSSDSTDEEDHKGGSGRSKGRQGSVSNTKTSTDERSPLLRGKSENTNSQKEATTTEHNEESSTVHKKRRRRKRKAHNSGGDKNGEDKKEGEGEQDKD